MLYVIVCAAGPASDVGKLVTLAQQRDWDVQIIATPSALDFVDVPLLETQTGRPVRSRYRKPDEPRSPKADAIIVAPATYNTINKWANGISDTYALGILAEVVGLGVPVAVLPFVNSALASRLAFKQSISQLQGEGVWLSSNQPDFQPHAPGTGDQHVATFPWHHALKEVEKALT
ncbi:flavoprotein [Actinomadura alba]|uniref:Flavoprotein n=2 Tax=Actinomadura alba TaxID=406431 RepID=A0ABR7LLI5_9ACTN|nr:flavoprotein [Actinomadura alba]